MDQTTVIKMTMAVLESGLNHKEIGGWAAIIAAKNMLIEADKELKAEQEQANICTGNVFSGVEVTAIAVDPDGKVFVGGEPE